MKYRKEKIVENKMICIRHLIIYGDVISDAECKIKANNSNTSGENGLAKRRMRPVIYILKEGNRVLISLRRFWCSEHSN